MKMRYVYNIDRVLEDEGSSKGWSLIMVRGGGGLQNGKIAGLKLFAPPPPPTFKTG